MYEKRGVAYGLLIVIIAALAVVQAFTADYLDFFVTVCVIFALALHIEDGR